MTQKEITDIIINEFPKDTIIPVKAIHKKVENKMKSLDVEPRWYMPVNENSKSPKWKSYVQCVLYQLKKDKQIEHLKNSRAYLIKDC